MAGTFAWFVMRGARSTFGRILRLPFAIASALIGFGLSQPLGPVIQAKITTDADMGDLQVMEVRPTLRGRVTAHRVFTQN
jgi:hypothetical protein